MIGKVVFRAMAYKNWTATDDGRPAPAAFFLREANPEKNRPEPEAALSVNVESHQSCHDTLIKCFGVAEVDTAACRLGGLTIEIDAHPHANLAGMPPRSVNAMEAERIAVYLSRNSILIFPADYQAKSA